MKPRRISLLAVLLAPLFTQAQLAAPQPHAGWTIEETMKVRMVGHVRIAPGGDRVLYTVRTALLDGDKGRYLTQIFMANTDGTNERALTGTDFSATSPEWSPDGRWIAFAADRSGRGDGNTLWIIPSNGGEPRAIDVGGTDVTTLKWSPDGKGSRSRCRRRSRRRRPRRARIRWRRRWSTLISVTFSYG